ncbi:diaminobutyrate--2-oxoglutarate transaminase [Halalkalibacterium halodurans]|jgi:diaminobutyrate-2-oxoglutarate transaminase|uniref:Diaminobutyrate--2-oxoglutarate transaminase n=2 Tax=Halalkalibacterium halodurans TaxID=86665 RepID=ECTB_HALH5|nr:diaminobutyrate--2-oxoglutarate transaminase [Halalkalibacterium halodurans]Q9KED4.1 RecName: Full=Diaminobutyrate--2-oxoglutarate transaminase; AltName: Full=DABA aminotransferase; AltName: Full=Diaminobutyrate--2-oxoglutarate aminotransferase; AltName: Full=L-2,4-diaminobutyric acid transaminase [Halalkalibacterium halodurans C-125]ABP52052.1 L-2,4-diaminobutyric acid aminotransferase [Halalkalibacterium halodurans]MED3648222.1 diaminobutyrate--2-oxoglutarate transaminase [Halalkalibacteriu
MSQTDMNVFEQLESEVRSYCRSFPTVFTKAKGYKMWDEAGKEYIDFFSGAGALNYGHNDEKMKKALVDYIMDDGITHSLDMATTPKGKFLQKFHDVILKPRNLDYKVMFPGPTGTNTVESALKLARKVTGRTDIISFTNGFHGMTIGSLSVTGNSFKRKGAGIPLTNVVTMPYDNFVSESLDTLDYLERFLEDGGSGVEIPAAMILETVQGEGGINAARTEWLQRVEKICKRWGILLIIDDVQAGVGRTGTFFSFEDAGITPDIVCLSKSIGGFGLPLAITLFRPELDIWAPGEHNGTFRGNNHAFVTATEALSYWEDDSFEKDIQEKSATISDFLVKLVTEYPEIKGEVKGKGFMVGIASDVEGFASKVTEEAFSRGLIMETSGPNDEVFKLFPPLTIDDEGLEKGLAIIEESIKALVETKELVMQ